MGIEQKAAVITGASQGIGAALVNAYRGRNYRVVATALSMEPLSGDDVVVVSGDITDRKTAGKISPRRRQKLSASSAVMIPLAVEYPEKARRRFIAGCSNRATDIAEVISTAT